MARSLSLAAYLALARRASNPGVRPKRERPKGALIWGVADSAARASALAQLIARLRHLRPDVHLLLTVPAGIQKPNHLGDDVLWEVLPEDQFDEAQAFLADWRPDFCLWTGGHLRPALVLSTSEKNIPMHLVDADEDGFDEALWRWLPNMAREVLSHFETVFANSANAAARLRKLGVPPEKITITGPLQDGGMALEYNISDREELSRILTGRPVWLAAMAALSEVEIILEAHKSASRLAHRLLLVLVPDDVNDGTAMRSLLESAGWRCAIWSEGSLPDEHTQILLADTKGEMGLWLQVAPITLMANSLMPGMRGKDPYEPASLGSAILYGPYVGRYLASYTRFANAGAARIVKDAETLAGAVSRLIAPDQAAAMALAAWDVASQGAEVTDMVIELVQTTLDKAEAH